MSAERYTFGPFLLDAGAFLLMREGHEVAIQPKALQMLVRLVRAAGELVPREALQSELWPDVVVTDQSMRQLLLRLREVLGEEHGKCIETVTRKGLRFVGEVQRQVEPTRTSSSAAPRSLGGLALKLVPEPLPDHLPLELDTFVGRTRDLVALDQMLREGARCVCVLGPGGVGKTRLVVHQARRCGDEVWFCDLSEACDLEGLVRAVARGLEVPLGKSDPVAQLGHALAGRSGRVILDNAEQLSSVLADTLPSWLARAERVQFVLTSREVLPVAGVVGLLLEPLSQDEAEALFLERAALRHRSFEPTPADREAIAALVQLLDALPLAIELAAGRVAILPPAQMIERMGERFRLLASRERRDRHATLRATLDWSHGLLSEAEQRALAQLSVFEGGFSLAAAEAVLALDSLWALDALQALVDKSLVRVLGPDRFGLLVSVQEYAAQHLRELGPVAPVEARHGQYYASLAAPLRSDFDNLVASCRRAVLRGDKPVAVRTLEAAWSLLRRYGPFRPGIALAEQVLALALEPRELGQVEGTLASTLFLCGRNQESHDHFVLALAAYQEAGDKRGCGGTLSNLANLYRDRGLWDQALATYDQALALVREVGAVDFESITLSNRGELHRLRGELQQARELYLASLALDRARGDPFHEITVMAHLGLLLREQGHIAEALVHQEAALALSQEISSVRNEVVVLGNLGNLYGDLGRPDEARASFERALALARPLGAVRHQGALLANLGALRSDAGHLQEALACYEQGLSLVTELGDERGEAMLRGLMGQAYVELGRLAEGREQYDAALTLFAHVSDERFLAILRGHKALLEAREGHFEQAHRLFDAALQVLRPLVDPMQTGILLCQRATALHLEGRADEAHASHAEARAIADQTRMGPSSELAGALERVAVLAGASLGTAPSGA